MLVFKNFICSLLLTVGLTLTPSEASIQRVDDFAPIRSTLEALEPGSIVVLDIDEVVLRDQEAILSPKGDALQFQIFNEYYSQAKTKKEIEAVTHTLSLPLILAKKVLVDEELPSLIKKLQDSGVCVIGLTSCPTEPFGAIENFEEWRLDQLRSYGIHLGRALPQHTRFTLDSMASEHVPSPIYNRGVLFTEGFTKADVLIAFMRKLNLTPKRIVFIDDMARNAHQMDIKLTAHQIPHQVFHYEKVHLESRFNLDEQVARFQYSYLFEHNKWLSDKEAKELLSKR